MKLEQSHIDQIRTGFEKMQSKQDLLDLLNQAKSMLYGDKAIPFELKQLTWYANPKLGTKRYAEFKVNKKSGSERLIHAPVKGLKSLQKTLSFILQCVYEPHIAAMGFVRNRSIVDNAILHVGSRYLYNIDLKDFFPSVDQARFWKVLQLKPFFLKDKEHIEYEPNKNTVKFKAFMLTKHYAGPSKKSETILYYEYEGFYFRKGFKKLVLKSGETIEYAINCINGEAKGDIEIYLERSSFESVKNALNKNNEEEVTPASLSHVFIQLIDLHQKKLALKDNKSALANIIASICFTEMEVERKNELGEWEKVKRNVLPQGAPTSPVITNIVCQKLDYLLTGVSKRFGLKYSRYADDITFSSMHNVYQPESEFLNELHRIIAEQNFHIKESKTRLQKDGFRKEVTGLLVNEKANVQQRYIKQLRMWLYYWERYGYERANTYFLEHYVSDKGHVKKGNLDMASVIAGKLDFLKMVKGCENILFIKLSNRYAALINNEQKNNYNRVNHLNSVLVKVFENGIDEAMKFYKK
jgi:retron-type reverse transcriptase